MRPSPAPNADERGRPFSSSRLSERTASPRSSECPSTCASAYGPLRRLLGGSDAVEPGRDLRVVGDLHQGRGSRHPDLVEAEDLALQSSREGPDHANRLVGLRIDPEPADEGTEIGSQFGGVVPVDVAMTHDLVSPVFQPLLDLRRAAAGYVGSGGRRTLDG